jgi:hypothetical protein
MWRIGKWVLVALLVLDALAVIAVWWVVQLNKG